MTHHDFSSTLRETWTCPVFGTKQYIFCMKLKALKSPLRILNKRNFSHISERVKRAQDSYAIVQSLLENDPSSVLLKAKVKECRETTNFHLEAERLFLQQKLKNQHLMLADRGGKYSHSLIRKKNSSNVISALVKSDGSYTTSHDEVVTEFLKYYSDLLGIDQPVTHISDHNIAQGPVLIDDDITFLSSPIDDESIKAALFQIGDDKAPGPNAFTATFFKNNWDTIKGEFLEVVKEFLRKGKLLKQFNHAVVALIPKTKHAPSANDFRPISCCNVFYKTISKIIANKIASAFLEERLMSDNVLFGSTTIRSYGRKTCTPRCMIHFHGLFC